MTEDRLKVIEAKCADSDDSSDEYSSGPTMTDECRELVAEVRRLRGLILEAERGSHETSCSGCEDGYDESYYCCPWCRKEGAHEADCDAFSAPGVVR